MFPVLPIFPSRVILHKKMNDLFIFFSLTVPLTLSGSFFQILRPVPPFYRLGGVLRLKVTREKHPLTRNLRNGTVPTIYPILNHVTQSRRIQTLHVVRLLDAYIP